MSWYHFSHSNQAEILWEHIKRGSYYDDSTHFPWKVCLLVVRLLVVRVMVLGNAGQQGLTALAVELSLLRRENQTCSFYREKGLAWAGISSKNIQPPYESLGRGGYRTDVIFNMPSSFPPGWHDSLPPALLAQCVSSESKEFLWMTRSRSMCGTDQSLTPANRRGDAEEGLGTAAKWTGHGASRSWKGWRRERGWPLRAERLGNAVLCVRRGRRLRSCPPNTHSLICLIQFYLHKGCVEAWAG